MTKQSHLRRCLDDVLAGKLTQFVTNASMYIEDAAVEQVLDHEMEPESAYERALEDLGVEVIDLLIGAGRSDADATVDQLTALLSKERDRTLASIQDVVQDNLHHSRVGSHAYFGVRRGDF